MTIEIILALSVSANVLLFLTCISTARSLKEANMIMGALILELNEGGNVKHLVIDLNKEKADD